MRMDCVPSVSNFGQQAQFTVQQDKNKAPGCLTAPACWSHASTAHLHDVA